MLKRTQPLRQHAPLKRTGWLRSKREKNGAGLAQRVAEMLGRAIRHQPQEPTVFRSKQHLRNVAALPCACCGRARHSQAAHTNMLALGKAKGLKASDALTFPLCADGVLVRGCHSKLDQSGKYEKAPSQAAQLGWLIETRDQLRRLGQWPPEADADFERFVVAYLERK